MVIRVLFRSIIDFLYNILVVFSFYDLWVKELS